MSLNFTITVICILFIQIQAKIARDDVEEKCENASQNDPEDDWFTLRNVNTEAKEDASRHIIQSKSERKWPLA